MGDCPRDDIRDLLPDLVHGQLEPEARVRVEQHLVACAECAAELELLRALRATAFAAPEVDVDRIAAAVRGAMTSAGSDADAGVADGYVVPIAAAARRGESSVGSVRTPGRAGAEPNRSNRRSIPSSWRIAAAIALVAAGAGGYALTRSGSAMFEPATEQATVAAAPESPATGAAPAGAPGRSAAKASAPASSLAAASDLAGFPDSGTGATKSTTGPLILGNVVNDLSESDMQTLLQSVDELEAMPDLEPHPLPVLSRVVEGAL